MRLEIPCDPGRDPCPWPDRLLGRVSNTLVDWLWFSSIGYEGVFWTIFTARTGLFLAVFAASAGAFWLSGGLALRFARGPAAAAGARGGLSPRSAANLAPLLRLRVAARLGTPCLSPARPSFSAC